MTEPSNLKNFESKSDSTQPLCKVIANWLVEKDVKEVFELSGGMIGHLIDAIYAEPRLKVLEVHHEQTAAFAAVGLSIFRCKPTVAIATSGPGALNLISGIAQAWYDSLPVIFIVGQVQSYLRQGNPKVRQMGLQESSFTKMVSSITKEAFSSDQAPEIAQFLESAWQLATSGRPGPVVIEVPFDLQSRPVSKPLLQFRNPVAEFNLKDNEIRTFLSALDSANKPLVIAGGGIRGAQAALEFRRFIERTGIPVVTSLRGLDLLPSSHPLLVGMIGMYGTRAANLTFTQSDTILILGCRVDHGMTSGNTLAFTQGRLVLRVDCDSGELSSQIKSNLTLNADLNEFLVLANEINWTPHSKSWASWYENIGEIRNRHHRNGERPYDPVKIDPNRFLEQLSLHANTAIACVIDVGQHSWWASQSYQLADGVRFISGGGLMSMGFGLCAAIGIAFGEGSPVVAVCGDGGFQCHIQELETIVRAKLPIKVVILNNQSHGAVRQLQDHMFGGRHSATIVGYGSPDFVAVAKAYGLPAMRIKTVGEIQNALKELWHDPGSPALLEVLIDRKCNAIPEVIFGAPLDRMWPKVSL
jgi:acetolactate synthase-1/2/3 large subunit